MPSGTPGVELYVATPQDSQGDALCCFFREELARQRALLAADLTDLAAWIVANDEAGIALVYDDDPLPIVVPRSVVIDELRRRGVPELAEAVRTRATRAPAYPGFLPIVTEIRYAPQGYANFEVRYVDLAFSFSAQGAA